MAPILSTQFLSRPCPKITAGCIQVQSRQATSKLEMNSRDVLKYLTIEQQNKITVIKKENRK